MDQASEYLNTVEENYDFEPQLCSPVDINAWHFSPLPSPESPFLDMPLSSMYQDSSWNAFDQAPGSLLTPDFMDAECIKPENLSATVYQNTFDTVNELQQSQTTSIDPTASDYASASQTSGGFSDTYTPTKTSQPSSPSEIQTTSEKPAFSDRTSSRISRRRKPSKTETEVEKPASKSVRRQRLRSTSTAITPSRPETSSASSYSSSSSSKHVRLNHNQVERHYRNRLNGQFETLLLVLPREEGDDGEEKKVSKAEVLVLAKEHIRDLERDGRGLEEENERLGGKMGGLKKRWVESGGVLLP